MLKTFINHFFAEVALTKLFDGVSLNLFNKIPMDVEPYCTDAIYNKWNPLLESKAFGINNLPTSIKETLAICAHNQSRFNKFAYSGSNPSMQRLTLPCIAKFISDTKFYLSGAYNVTYCTTIKYIAEEDFNVLWEDSPVVPDYIEAVLECIVDDMEARLDPSDMNGLLLIFNENSVDVYA